MADLTMKRFVEEKAVGCEIRQKQFDQLDRFIEKRRASSNKMRQKFLTFDHGSIQAYEKDIKGYREMFKDMLGWSLFKDMSPHDIVGIKEQYLGEDELAYIYRLEIDAIDNLPLYGLLFIPKTGRKKYQLVFALHGGGGCPELISGIYGTTSNYNEMAYRIIKQGFMVFAPQLHLWNEDYGPVNKRIDFDQKLRLLGSSITALEVFRLQRGLSALINREDVDDRLKVGICGLSYGGMYTLFTAAIETRFSAALSSCWFNKHWYKEGNLDWVWNNAARTFYDAQICALVCPRSLCIEVGVSDELFIIDNARQEIDEAKKSYKKLGIIDRFNYIEAKGGHEFNQSDESIDWFITQLR